MVQSNSDDRSNVFVLEVGSRVVNLGLEGWVTRSDYGRLENAIVEVLAHQASRSPPVSDVQIIGCHMFTRLKA